VKRESKEGRSETKSEKPQNKIEGTKENAEEKWQGEIPIRKL
jgi:hypothetical protein